MERSLRWPIGFVALVGALVTTYAASVGGETLPHRGLPVFGLGVVFAVISALCFWPWRRGKASKDAGTPPTKTLPDPQDARRLGGYMLANGGLVSLIGYFGGFHPRFPNATPWVLIAGGLVTMTVGLISLCVSFSGRSTIVAYWTTRTLLYGLFLLSAALPAGALVALVMGL